MSMQYIVPYDVTRMGNVEDIYIYIYIKWVCVIRVQYAKPRNMRTDFDYIQFDTKLVQISRQFHSQTTLTIEFIL